MLHVITVSSYETSGSLLVTVFREQYCSLIVSLLPRTEGHVPPSAPVKAFHIYPTSPHVRTEGSCYRRSHLFFVAAGAGADPSSFGVEAYCFAGPDQR